MFNKETEINRLRFEIMCLQKGICRFIPDECDKCGTCSDPECTWNE